MKRTIGEHAARFDEKAASYDDRERPVYERCVELVVDAAAPTASDVVLDLGTGTGEIALALAPHAGSVVGRDISTEMLEVAREKAVSNEIDTVEFASGRFREPNYDGGADVITSNYALHHLGDDEKRQAIQVVARYQPRRFVLGDLMIFGRPNPDEQEYHPDVDDPATVGTLAEAMTAVGFDITRVDRITDQAGVIVAEEPRDGWDA